MKAEVEKFEKSFEQEKQSIEKSVRAALAQSESLGQELMTQRLERLELLSASTLEVAAAVLASQQDSRLALATLPSSAVVDEDFVTSLNDRYSQASTGAVPLVQSSISRAQSIIVDGSEQQFLNGIARARDELAMVLPRITNLHSKLLSHNGVRSSYYDVATAMLDNLAVNCNVYSGVDYTSLTHATQQLLGQASTSNSLPVPYVPEPQVASQVPPGD
jgi:mannitol/fructose-specific phosphotransferase system IIA component